MPCPRSPAPRRPWRPAALGAFLLAVGCEAPPEPVEILGFEVQLDSECSVCATATVTMDVAATTTLFLGEWEESAEAWVRVGPGTQLQIPVLELRSETTYAAYVEATGDEGQITRSPAVPFTTGPLPEDLPPIRLEVADSERMQPGLTVFPVGSVL